MSEVTFKPAKNKYLVEKVKGAEKSKGGIIIPDAVQSSLSKAKVLIASAKMADDQVKYDTGEVVAYYKQKGIEVNIDGTTYLLLDTTEIAGAF